MRLFHKFLLVMLIPSIGSIAWLGNELIKKSKYSLETPMRDLQIRTAENLKKDFENRISVLDRMAMFLFGMMSNMDWEGKQALLASSLVMDNSVKSVAAVTLAGSEVIKAVDKSEKNADLKDISKEAYFRLAANQKKRVIKLSKDHGTIIILYPFNKFFIKLEIYKDIFFKDMKFERIGETGVSMILDAAGEVVHVSEGFSPEEFRDSPSWEITKQALKRVSSGTLNYRDEKGQECLGAYAAIPDISGVVIVRQTIEDVFRYALSVEDEAFKIVLLFAVAIGLLAYFFSRTLTLPIIRITQAADFVAKGDFNHRVEVTTNDELKDLADTFNEMTEKLKTYSEMQIDRILREQKNTQAVLFSTEDGIIMVDMNGKIQLINRAASSVMGLESGNPENMDIRESVKDDKIKEAINDLMEKKQEGYFREFEVESAQSRRVFKAGLTEISLPDRDEKMGYLIAIYDITLAKELERMKDDFLHSITHDLRNPMGAIKGFVEFMLKEIPGPVNEAQRKMLVSIDRAAFRLLGMINNILDSARISAGKMDINLSSFNMKEIAARVLELLESLGQRKKIKFVLDSPEDIVVNADANLMERVFTNLIGNSIKFTPEDGTITIGLRKEGKLIRAWVEDTGDGIPPDYIDKIFQKFEQVKGQKRGGTGLGLTIARNVVEAHLGRIWAEYRPNKGALFVFTFPLNLSKDEHGRVIADE